MNDIMKTPLSELLDDLVASAKDAGNCELAIAAGVTKSVRDGRSYVERRDVNNGIVSLIRKEIARRVNRPVASLYPEEDDE